MSIESKKRVADDPSAAQTVGSADSPGQSLTDLLTGFDLEELRRIVGPHVANTIKLLVPAGEFPSAIRLAAVHAFHNRSKEVFGNASTRRSLIQGMTAVKREELGARVGLRGAIGINSLDPTRDGDIWREYLAFFGVTSRKSSISRTVPDIEEFKSNFNLFPHQRGAVARTWKALSEQYDHTSPDMPNRKRKKRTVLHMPTGAGKTRTAMHVVCRTLVTYEPCVVVWLAASAELLEQAVEAFGEAWTHIGNRNLKVARFWASHAPILSGLDDGLVVASLQKMHARLLRDRDSIIRLGSRVKLVVMDEAHQAVAPTYRELISELSAAGEDCSLLGLTATPGRSLHNMDADMELSTFFDQSKVMLEAEDWKNPVSFLMSEGYLARPAFRRLEYTPSKEIQSKLKNHTKREQTDDGDNLDMLAEHAERNVTIVKEIVRLAKSHSRILVFAASVNHAGILAAALASLRMKVDVVTGNTPLYIRHGIIKKFKSNLKGPMVICNFGVLTTGFDAPNTSAVVIARPTQSLVLYSQMVGRATRGPKAGGNETCEVSTVMDIDFPGFGDVAKAFTHWEEAWHDQH